MPLNSPCRLPQDLDGVPQVLDEILKQQKKSTQVLKRCREIGASEYSSEFNHSIAFGKFAWVEFLLGCRV